MFPLQRFLFFLLIFGHLFSVNESLSFKTLSTDCCTNPKYVTNATCKTVPVNRYLTVSNMDCFLLRPMNLSMRLILFKKDYSNRFHMFLVNVTGNLCEVLSRKSFSTYLVLFKNAVQNYTNVKPPCPFNGHVWARNFSLDYNLVPVPLPLGIYRLRMEFIENNSLETIGNVLWSFEAIETNTFPLGRKKKP